jgi:hypothetical protein
MIFPDLHRPIEDKRAYPLVMQFAEDFKPEIIVNLGDIGNFAGISHWNVNRFKSRMEYPIKRDFDGAKDHHKRLREIVPETSIYSLDGNHDDWVQDYLDLHPELEGYVDYNKGMAYAEFNVKRIPRDRQPLKIGKLQFIHGWYLNKYHTFKTSQTTHHNIVYAHTHTFQSFTPDNIEPDRRFMAWSIGHLSDEKIMARDYLRDRPTNWMLGFAIFWMDMETGDFTLFPIALPNYRFAYNGKMYKA